jgi:hypothetical protein
MYLSIAAVINWKLLPALDWVGKPSLSTSKWSGIQIRCVIGCVWPCSTEDRAQ